MGDKTVSVRVKFEGGQAVKAGLQEVGREGTRALQSIGGMAASTRGQLQNAGYQVSDFFVQIAGGTAPTRALAQQMPQLLQGLGLVGVAASVLIAAAPSLWALFQSGADDSEALKKQLDGVAKAVDAASGAADLAREPIESLRKKYGDLAESIRDARVQAAELARAKAARSVNDLLTSTQSPFGETGDSNSEIAKALAVEQAYKRIAALKAILTPEQAQLFDFTGELADLGNVSNRIKEVRAGIQAMADDYGITFDQAAAVASAMDRVRDSASKSSAEQIAAAQTLVGFLTEVYGSAAAADEATGGLVTKLTESVIAAGDLAAIDFAGPIWDGADAATALANELARAASLNYGKVANAGGMDSVARGEMAKFTPNIFPTLASGAGGISPSRPGRGGGGGGGGGGVDPDIARAKALTEGLRTETEKYAASLEEVNRLKEKGLITDETYARQLDKLKTGLGETSDLAKKAAGAIRSAFDGLFDDPKQALKDLAKQLAMMALYMQLAKSFPGAFGAGGAVPLIPGFASGGRHRGGLRIVGENGPELEATGPSTIYPNDMLRRMGGGGGSVAVNVNNYSGGEVTTTERKGPNGARIIDVEVTRSIGSGKQDSALRSRFGSRPATVKR